MRRPDDWHLASARRRDAGRRPARDRPAISPAPSSWPKPRAPRGHGSGDAARLIATASSAALPDGMAFETADDAPYLTETTEPADMAAAHAEGLVTAVKLYPAGATTNSASGVRDLSRVMPVLEKMAENRPAALHPRRGHDARGRYLRPRESVPRHCAGPSAPQPAGAEGDAWSISRPPTAFPDMSATRRAISRARSPRTT